MGDSDVEFDSAALSYLLVLELVGSAYPNSQSCVFAFLVLEWSLVPQTLQLAQKTWWHASLEYMNDDEKYYAAQ